MSKSDKTQEAPVWFLREGQALDLSAKLNMGAPRFVSKVEVLSKDRALVREQHVCNRCGGAGGSVKWEHTGWTCYECNGSRLGKVVDTKLYSAEKLEKLNVAWEKRQAKARQKQLEKQAQEEAARLEGMEAQIATNRKAHPEAMAILEKVTLTEGFLADVKEKAFSGFELTQAMAEAVIKSWKVQQEIGKWDDRVSSIEENAYSHAMPAGRTELTGYILSCQWRDSYNGQVLKILFLDERGFKVWVSLPKGMKEHMERDEDGYLIERSAHRLRIRFVATLEPKESKFAFGTRPSKLEFLDDEFRGNRKTRPNDA